MLAGSIQPVSTKDELGAQFIKFNQSNYGKVFLHTGPEQDNSNIYMRRNIPMWGEEIHI